MSSVLSGINISCILPSYALVDQATKVSALYNHVKPVIVTQLKYSKQSCANYIQMLILLTHRPRTEGVTNMVRRFRRRSCHAVYSRNSGSRLVVYCTQGTSYELSLIVSRTIKEAGAHPTSPFIMCL